MVEKISAENTLDTIRLYPDKTFHLVLGVMCGAGALVLIDLLLRGKGGMFLLLLFSALFAGVAIFLTANVVFKNKVYLQVDAEGLAFSTLFSSSYVRWADIESFCILPPHTETAAQLIIVLYDERANRKSSVRDMGQFPAIGYLYGKGSVTELAMFLDARLQLYRQVNEALPPQVD